MGLTPAKHGPPRRLGRRIMLRIPDDILADIDAEVARDKAAGRSSDRGLVVARRLRWALAGS